MLRTVSQRDSWYTNSGGCDRHGRVPILPHLNDLVRVRRELGMTIRVHPGLPDEETVIGAAEIDIDGAMVDIIGSNRTIRDVYHLDAKIEDYDAVMERSQSLWCSACAVYHLGTPFWEDAW